MQINTKLKLVYSGENSKEIIVDTNNVLVGEFLKRLDFSKDLISVFYGKASLNVKIKDLVSFTTESTCPIMSIHEFEEKVSSKKKEKNKELCISDFLDKNDTTYTLACKLYSVDSRVKELLDIIRSAKENNNDDLERRSYHLLKSYLQYTIGKEKEYSRAVQVKKGPFNGDKARYKVRKPIITPPITDTGDKLKKAFNELKTQAQHDGIPVITAAQTDYSGITKRESELTPTAEITKSNDNKLEYKPRNLTVYENKPTSNNIIPTAEVLKVANRLKETDDDVSKAFNEMAKVFKECKDAGLLDMEKPKRWENPIYNKYKEKMTLLKNTLIKKGAFEDIRIAPPARRIGKSMEMINANSIYGAGITKYAGSDLDSNIANFTIQKSRPVKQHISADKNKDLPERKKRLYNK